MYHWFCCGDDDTYMMFFNSKFNEDISDWNVSNVLDMTDTFRLSPLEKNPPKWYIS